MVAGNFYRKTEMKARILTIITFLLFASFAQAGVPEKIIASDTIVVERFYNHNENYKTPYTTAEFDKKVCSLNPKRFKKCSDYEFRHQQKGVVFFPALPEAKSGKTIKQVYQNNEVYRVLFGSFTKFQQEICKNNPEKLTDCAKTVLQNLKTSGSLKITSRPETYLIPGEESTSVIIEEKTFTKTTGGYYHINHPVLNTTQTKERKISTIKESVPAKSAVLTTPTKEETTKKGAEQIMNPYLINTFSTTKPPTEKQKVERRREIIKNEKENKLQSNQKEEKLFFED